jgi:hypothetical protein
MAACSKHIATQTTDQLVRAAVESSQSRDMCVIWGACLFHLQAAPAAVDVFDCDGVTTTVTNTSLHPDDEL